MDHALRKAYDKTGREARNVSTAIRITEAGSLVFLDNVPKTLSILQELADELDRVKGFFQGNGLLPAQLNGARRQAALAVLEAEKSLSMQAIDMRTAINDICDQAYGVAMSKDEVLPKS